MATAPHVGDAMTLHPDIDKISFHRFHPRGPHCADQLRLHHEALHPGTGWQGPRRIVLPDADLDMVAQGSLWAVYMNAGPGL